MASAEEARRWAATYSINRAHELYQQRSNPHHCWDAYWWARSAGMPIPDWVLQYLDGCAERLRKHHPTSPKEVAASIGMAIRGGGPSIRAQARGESERHKAARMVRINKDMDRNKPLEEIFAKIANKLGRHEDYVRDAYYEFRHNW